MDLLTTEQIAYFQCALELKKQNDHTFMLLSDCVNRLNNELLAHPTKRRIRAYSEAVRVLNIHNEWLSYQVGLQHGRQEQGTIL